MSDFFFGAGRQYKDPTWRKKGKRAYMRFYDAAMNPTRVEVALGTSSEATAAVRFHELKRQYMLGQYDPWRDHASLQMPLEKAIRSYVAEEHIRPSMRKSRRVRLSPFARENPGIYCIFRCSRPPNPDERDRVFRRERDRLIGAKRGFWF